MDILIAILTLVLAGLVALVVSAPLRHNRVREPSSTEAAAGPAVPQPPSPGGHTADELGAAREAKYREIRDAELDFRTGKLSPEDYRAIDASLRKEAIAILNELERIMPGDA